MDDWIQEKLQTRAKGNFYAKLVAEWLQYDWLSIDDIKYLITSRVPNKIAEMYRRIFFQCQEEQHKYIRYGKAALTSLCTLPEMNSNIGAVSFSPLSPTPASLCVYPSFMKR